MQLLQLYNNVVINNKLVFTKLTARYKVDAKFKLTNNKFIMGR